MATKRKPSAKGGFFPNRSDVYIVLCPQVVIATASSDKFPETLKKSGVPPAHNEQVLNHTQNDLIERSK